MPLEKIGPFEYRRFEPTLPAFDKVGHEAKRHQVLVVGGGPVGLATALGLANWGIRSVVVEADDSVCEGSRAACISRRSLEILERLGAVSQFLRKGLPWTRGRSFYGVQEVLVFDMPTGTGDKYPPMINLEQYYIEQYLLDSIDDANARSPGMVEIRWASKVVECSPGSNGVELRIENALGNYQTEADWIVACDGGQSFVRSSLGLELKGIGYQGRYAIVDIELASDQPAERRAWFDPPWARGTTILMHRQPDDIWRVDYQLAAGLDAAQVLQPEQIRQFVQTHLDAIGEGHLPWTPVWTSLYRAGAMTLDAYRHGRILFAGNAAHAMPIFGGRGLNSGFDDADNLIWKLATVVKGLGTEALLDSYSSERVQAFHINAESAMRSTEFMSPPHRGVRVDARGMPVSGRPPYRDRTSGQPSPDPCHYLCSVTALFRRTWRCWRLAAGRAPGGGGAAGRRASHGPAGTQCIHLAGFRPLPSYGWCGRCSGVPGLALLALRLCDGANRPCGPPGALQPSRGAGCGVPRAARRAPLWPLGFTLCRNGTGSH